MRRSHNEVTDKNELLAIIKACDVVRIGMSLNDVPYIVPLNFGYDKGCFYFHGAKEGRKMDIIQKNPHVCFELDTDHMLIGESQRACDWTMKYASVMGTGKMIVIDDVDEKRLALNILMKQYGGDNAYTYEDKMLQRIGIMKLDVAEMTGKKSL